MSQGVTLHLSVINRFPFFSRSISQRTLSLALALLPPPGSPSLFTAPFFFVLLSCCLPSILEWWQPAVTTTPALLTTEQTRQQHWWHCPLNVSLWAVLGPILDANFFLFSFIYSLDSCSCFFFFLFIHLSARLVLCFFFFLHIFFIPSWFNPKYQTVFSMMPLGYLEANHHLNIRPVSCIRRNKCWCIIQYF